MNYPPMKFDETPRELFDQKRWKDCLHATIQCYNLANEPTSTQAAIEDTGVIHELVHLSCNIETWTPRTLAELRELLPE